jgi:phenylpropionate dioxygenase-like ring-hydroxylating dioxygenase large terminal subunit
MPSTVQPRSIQALLSQWRPGHALPGGFYTRPDVFEADLRLLESRWICAGHISELARAGDWLTAELGAESAIVTRGEDGAIRAMANVCRHRGSRLCVGARGHATLITCPYHAWSYHLDGRLRAAREMPDGFDAAGHGLAPLPIRIVGGLIFVSFADDPPAFGEAGPALEAMMALYGWADARIAHRRSYRVAANWKLVMENYHECYHCGPAHPEFSVLHALARPGARTLSSEPDPATGLSDFEAWAPTADGREVGRVMRSALAEGTLTGGADGRPLAPPMGDAGARWDGDCVFGELGFLSAFLAYADHGVIYRFIPRGVLDTEMEVIWLVAGEAVEGRDYDLARLTWLWDLTSQADKRIIECNQAGVTSRAYRPGPFSLMEPGTRAYVERYVAELAAGVAREEGRDHGL